MLTQRGANRVSADRQPPVPQLVGTGLDSGLDVVWRFIGIQWCAIGFALILSILALMLYLALGSRTFYLTGMPLDATGSSMDGYIEFQCEHDRVDYKLDFSLPTGETQTRLLLEFIVPSADPGTYLPIPLCRNPLTDPANPYGGPDCTALDSGTLSTALGGYVTLDSSQCKQLAANPTLMRIRLFSSLHPGGILIAGLTRFSQ